MALAAHHPMTNCQATHLPSTVHRVQEGRIRRMIRLWRARIRERREFASLDDRELHDLGLSRFDVARELAKPFWRG